MSLVQIQLAPLQSPNHKLVGAFFMAYTIYILQSESYGRLYKGMTEYIAARLRQHNAGKVKSAKAFAPWEVVHTESYSSTERARTREKYFKSAAGRRWIKKHLALQLVPRPCRTVRSGGKSSWHHFKALITNWTKLFFSNVYCLHITK